MTSGPAGGEGRKGIWTLGIEEASRLQDLGKDPMFGGLQVTSIFSSLSLSLEFLNAF